jgi:RNA polymerase sigma factor (sigma-70 family)
MVWGVCRRTLGSDHASAEDACQAAFVALAVKAPRIRDRHALAAWLHRVALRAALDLTVRRPAQPLAVLQTELIDARADPALEASEREVRSELDAGVNRLPEKLRIVFVLCEMEGRSNAEAAVALGCPVGTVESRLTRARHKLRDWLIARGVIPSVAATATVVPESAWAAMAKASVPATVTPGVQALAARSIPTVFSAKLRVAMAVTMLLGFAAVGLGVSMKEPSNPPKVDESLPVAPDPKPIVAAPRKPNRREAERVPLPPGVVARLGSPLLRHSSSIPDASFSPDGKRLVAVDHLAIRVWDTETGTQRLVIRRPAGPWAGFERVSFTDGGKTIVALGRDADGKADLWRIDAATGEVSEKFWAGTQLSTEYAAARFSPNGSRVAIIGGMADDKLMALDTTTGKVLWSLEFRSSRRFHSGLDFTADGNTLAVCGIRERRADFDAATEVRLFDAATGQLEKTLKDHDDARFETVAFSPDGSMVVAVDEEAVGLVAWDRASGKRLWKVKDLVGGLRFTPDGKTLICTEYNPKRMSYKPCTVNAADGTRGTDFENLTGRTSSAVRPDGKVVAFGRYWQFRLFDTTTGNPVAPNTDPLYQVGNLRFSPDGQTLFGTSSQHSVSSHAEADWLMWDVPTGVQSRVMSYDREYITTQDRDQDVATLSSDGRFVLRWSGTRDQPRLDVRDTKTKAVVHSHAGKEYWADWYMFTPDGQAVIAGGKGVQEKDSSIRVWAVETGKELARMTGHSSKPQHSWYRACSADGRVLVTGTLSNPTEDFPVRVWDVKTGKELAKFLPEMVQGVSVGGVVISADGSRVAAHTVSPRFDLPIHFTTIWDVASGKVLARIQQPGHGGEIALSPDGQLVALSAWRSSEIHVHDVATGAERFVFKHEGWITGLTFAPDNRTLAAASSEAPIYLWDVTGKGAGR